MIDQNEAICYVLCVLYLVWGWLIRTAMKRNVVPLFVVSNTSAYEEVIRVKCGCLVSYDYDGPGCGDENNLNANHMQYH